MTGYAVRPFLSGSSSLTILLLGMPGGTSGRSERSHTTCRVSNGTATRKQASSPPPPKKTVKYSILTTKIRPYVCTQPFCPPYTVRATESAPAP
ncbi:hypothetical protein GALMADRAFT_258853 [Galerina marginata CBS 339.88]|uniref:Secreted protein n=1 Tax=Galerina marginata (strain CBS 339.88) TaxID=685588 RepID=A0A067S7X1_GALM3|nr:hypothetical protein GALMADRAFT_258853 [Galerina marginata CBS 339.88]